MRLACAIGVIDGDLGAALHATDLHAHVHGQLLLFKNFLRFLGHCLVCRAEEHRQRFQHRDFRTQTPPNAAHLQPDHARAYDAQALGRFGQRQRTCVVQDQLVVERCTRQRAWGRTGGDDHMFGHQCFCSGARDVDLPRAGLATGECAAAMEERHLVLLEEIENAFVVLFNNLVFALLHLRHVHREACDLDAMISE